MNFGHLLGCDTIATGHALTMLPVNTVDKIGVKLRCAATVDPKRLQITLSTTGTLLNYYTGIRIYYLLTGCKGRTGNYKPEVFHIA